MDSEQLEFVLGQIFFIVVLSIIAFIHRYYAKKNITYSHKKWTIFYFVLFVPLWFVFRNPLLLVEGVLIREVWFSPFLNLIRGKKFWYTNNTETDPNDSVTDDFNEQHKTLSKIFYFVSFAGIITINLIYFL